MSLATFQVTTAGCVAPTPRASVGRPSVSRNDATTRFRDSTAARLTHVPRGRQAWETNLCAVASTTSAGPSGDVLTDEVTDLPDDAGTRLAFEAMMTAKSFNEVWSKDATCRSIITGESTVQETQGQRVPRRRGPPSASDIAREAEMLKSKQTHPNAEAYRSRKFRREAIRQLYAIIVPSLVPRDQFIGYSGLLTSCVYSAPHVSCVTAALKIIPQVLSDVSPANAARRLIALKNDNDDSFDVVEAVTKNPKLLLKTPKPRGDDPEDLTAQRLERSAKDAASATKAATAKLIARVLGDEGAKPEKKQTVDSKYKVGGTLKGTSTRAGDLCVRFWNLWGGSSQCRKAVTESPRGSVYRDPSQIESKVLCLDSYCPFIDAPMLLHRAPVLLEMDTTRLVREIVKMKTILPGGDVGRLLELAPGLLLAVGTGELEQAVTGVHRELGSGGKKEKATDKAVFQEAKRLVQSGGAASLLARGKVTGGTVVAVTEKTNVHFEGVVAE